MKSPLHLSLVLLLLALSFSGYAQPVTFGSGGQQPASIAGNSYEDCSVDMNGDFLDDVVRVTSLGIYIDYQQPDGGFEQSFFSMLIQNPPTWSINAGDIDGNGFNDLLFGNGSRVSFVYANSDGTGYNEVGFPEYIFSQRGTFADIDNDGHLDAFVCHDVDLSHPYRNDGNGNMVLDQSLIETIDAGGNYASVWCDYDNDGDIDMYLTKCRGGAPYMDPQRLNGLYRNNGDGTFTEVGAAANMDDRNQSWTTIFEDFDNDGWFDAFTVNHSSGDVPGGPRNKLMHNNGDGTFTDIIDGSGIAVTDLGAWNCDAGDFNNDGFVDILSELNKELYLNNGDGTFTGYDLPFNSGGIADLNNDGFLDVVRGNTVWYNSGNGNNYLKISLEGIISNLNGIGSRIEIYGDWGIQVREVRSGTSFSPMKSLNTHFGLGTSTAVDSLVVLWPSGTRTSIHNPEINTTHHIPEAACVLASMPISISGEIPVICEGSDLELTAADGFETYQWNTGEVTQSITVTEAGNYSVIMTDENNCIAVSEPLTVNVITDDVLTLSALGDTEICEGSSVEIEASLATDYQWNTGEQSQVITADSEGMYYATASGACGPVSSDTVYVQVLPAPAPQPDEVQLDEPGVVTLTATGENILWYETEDATEPIGSGNSFETPFLDEFTQYWAEATWIYEGTEESGGKPDNTGAGGLPSVGAYSYFNVWEPFTLLNVRVYVPESAGAGVREVELTDAAGNVLQSASFDLEPGEHVITLDFNVPAGQEMSLRCPQNNLFRNSSGVNYPYPIGSVGELYDSFYGGSYYYYFYDWNIQLTDRACVSERVPFSIVFTGLEELQVGDDFEVFPVPAEDELNVLLNFAASSVQIGLFDIRGKLIAEAGLQSVVAGQVASFSLNNPAPGMYILQLTADGRQQSRKVIIR